MTDRAGAWFTYSMVALLVALAVGWLAVRTFLFDLYRMPSESMYPTIPERSFFIVDKRGYGNYSLFGVDVLHRPMTASVARGDILVHKLPGEGTTSYVKRVIGLPGDRIEYVDNHLTINGKPAALTGVRHEGWTTHATEVLDDVRASISWANDHLAKDYAVVVPEGHYVFFGDNRNNSRDSRFVGPVARELIVGKVVKVFPSK